MTRTITRSLPAIAVIVAGCAAAPLNRTLPTEPIDTSSGTVLAARQELEGRWALMSFNATAPDGRQTPVDSTGVLTLDKFGNLKVELRVTDTGRAALARIGVEYPSAISTEGRVVIDTQQHKITYLAPGTDTSKHRIDKELAARRANPFALEHDRFYAIGDDGVLTLQTKHDNGTEAATSRWHRPLAE